MMDYAYVEDTDSFNRNFSEAKFRMSIKSEGSDQPWLTNNYHLVRCVSE